MEQDTRPENVPMLMVKEKTAKEEAKEKEALDGGDDDLTSNSAALSRARARATCAQCLVTGAVFLLSAGCGFPIGFSAVALPQLREPNSSLPTDDDMGSWVASVHSAATPVGAFCSGLLSERLGRRSALQVTALPFFVGWALVALARSHAVLIAGRAIAGLAVGLSAAPGQVLISEVAEPRNRGALCGMPMVSYSLGILIVYALGSALPWRSVAWLGTALPLAALLALSLLPESPTWLAQRGRLSQARKALQWLRGGDAAATQTERELEQLVERISEEMDERPRRPAAATVEPTGSTEEEKSRQEGCCSNPFSCLRMFSQPDVYKPFLIVTTLNMMQIFSGTYLVIFYAVDLLAQADAGMDKFLAAVLTAVVRLVFTATACGLLSWTGRRPLALSSGVASGLAAVAMGTALYVRPNAGNGTAAVVATAEATAAALSSTASVTEAVPGGGGSSDPYSAIITGCLLVYMAANTCGFFVLPLVTIGELLPAKVRGLAGGYIFASFNLGLFAVTKVFPKVATAIGAHGIFWIFGASSLAGTVFIYLALPETKGQSLAQIEDYFKGPNFLWVTRHKQHSTASKV